MVGSQHYVPPSYNEILRQAHKIGGIEALRSPEFHRQVDLYLELHEKEFGAQSTTASEFLSAVQNLHDPASLPMFKRIADGPNSNLARQAAIAVAIIAPEDEFYSHWVRRQVEESIRNDWGAPALYFPWLPIDEVIEHYEAVAADARAKLAELPDESEIADAAERRRIEERRRILERRLVKDAVGVVERHRWLEDDEPDVVIARLISVWGGSKREHVDRNRALQTLRRRGMVEEFAAAVRRHADERRDPGRRGAMFGELDELGVAFTDDDYARIGRTPPAAPE